MSGWPIQGCFSDSESQIVPAHWVQPAVHHFTNREKLVPDPRYTTQGQMKIKIAGVSIVLPRGNLLPQIVPFHGEGNCTKGNKGHSGNHNGNQPKRTRKHTCRAACLASTSPIIALQVAWADTASTVLSAIVDPLAWRRALRFARKKKMWTCS